MTGNWLEASKVGYSEDVSLGSNENTLPDFTEGVSIVENLFGRPNAIRVNEGQDQGLAVQGNWISGRWLGSAGLGAPLGHPPYGVVGGEHPDGLGTNLNDRFDGTDAREWFIGNSGNDELHGAGGMDRLDGGSGDDLLDGGAETDTLLGGAGNDRYIIDSPNEVLEEPGWNSGIDTVESGVSWTLGDRFENLVLTGDGTNDGTGNAAVNLLTGNDAANRLSGDAGDDLITAGTGDDWLSGGPDDDQLDGGAGNDVLDGGSGSDLMSGGSGNDIYYVDGLGDLITEQPGAGQDTVFSAVSYVLPPEVETLRLSGSTGIDGAGNGLANEIFGNGGPNTLAGGAGDDQLAGGDGADKLTGGGGNDLMEGGPGDDSLDGGSGDDILAGDAGADVLTGGPGRDTFVLRRGDAMGDRITDFHSGGTEGDTLRLEGYGPGASLILVGSTWVVMSNEGAVDNFELTGITKLDPADIWFV